MNAIEAAFQGRIAKAPTLRTSQSSGKPWAMFSVAIGNEDHADHVQWVNVVVFGADAEAASTLAKGTLVYVEGKLRLETWEKDGQPRSGLKVTASRVQPMGQIGQRKPPTAKASAEGAPAPRSSEPVYRPLDGASTGKRDPDGALAFADAEIPF